MPESAGHERRQAGTETGFLAFGRDAQVHVVSEPVVGVHVPVFEICAGILGGLNAPWIDILKTVPLNAACFGIDTFVTKPG